MNPKFSVGEVVILQSKTRPEFNGECTISEVIRPGESYICRVTGVVVWSGTKYICYLIDEKHHMTPCDNGLMTTGMWAEFSIRKKHHPGELSYTELLESLTVKNGEPA